MVAPPFFFLVGVVTAAAVGVAADDDLLFDEELGVFFAFLGYNMEITNVTDHVKKI